MTCLIGAHHQVAQSCVCAQRDGQHFSTVSRTLPLAPPTCAPFTALELRRRTRASKRPQVLAQGIPNAGVPLRAEDLSALTATADGLEQQASMTAEAYAAVEVPLASLSRVMYSSVQPARVARGVGVSSGGGRSTPSSVLSSLAILALTVTTAGIAAVRAKIRAVRECSTCHGYGVQRCKLCSGKGTIEWEGKLAHREPCPMCLGRRFNNCTCCGGGTLFARHLFNHKHSNPVDAGLVDNLQSLAKEGRLSRWAAAIPPALRLRRTVSDQEERRELSQQFAEEIMTD